MTSVGSAIHSTTYLQFEVKLFLLGDTMCQCSSSKFDQFALPLSTQTF